MKQISLAVSLLVGVGLLSSCGSAADTDTDPTTLTLDGRTFTGTTATVDDKAYPLAQGSVLRLTFDDGRISGSGGCNTFSGPASWDTGTLKIEGGALAMTEMACDQPLMDQDTWFAEVLASKPTLAQDGDTLTLTSGKAVVVLADEDTTDPDRPLVGTTWQLDSIVTANAVSSVPSGSSATVSFSDDGSVSAFLGCNKGRGTYTVDGGTLMLGSLSSTKVACEPPASEVEDAMLSVLNGAVGFSIDGDQLVLSPNKVSGDSPTALEFTGEAGPPPSVSPGG